MNNISIVIPNYNGEKILQDSLSKTVEAANYYLQKNIGTVEIVIIDDGSKDNSMSIIKDFIQNNNYKNIQFKILQNEKNLGFSSTVNKGVEKSGGEIVILLNTDVAPQKDFLMFLLKHFTDEKVFAVGCVDKSIEGKNTVFRGRGIGKWQRGFLVHARGEVNRSDTLWVSGGSSAFRKSIWEKLGGFNELYNPFYWEDIDLSYRALKSGYKVLFEPKSIVVHEHEKGSIKGKYSSFKIKVIAYRNQFIFVWENATDIDLQFLHIFWLPYYFIKALISLDLAFFAAFFGALILLPKIIQSSFKAQKFFVKGDREVIRNFLE